MIQAGARHTLARLRERQPRANAGSPASGKLRAALLQLGKEPTPTIRASAVEKLEAAKAAFARASGVAWYAGLAVRYANYARWKPFQNEIDEAADSLAKGDREGDEPSKRVRYISSWQRASAAVEGIEREERGGSTNLSMVLDAGAEKASNDLKALTFDLSPLYWLLGGFLVVQLVRR